MISGISGFLRTKLKNPERMQRGGMKYIGYQVISVIKGQRIVRSLAGMFVDPNTVEEYYGRKYS